VSEVHLVVFQEGDPALEPGFARERVYALEHLLAGLVGRVRLPGEDKLDRSPRVGQEALQPVEIAEDQRRPLVGREPPGESDRQSALLEQRSGAHQVQRFLPLIRPTPPGIVADRPQQRPLQLAVRLPHGGVLETEDRVPESRLVHPVGPIGAEVGVEQVGHAMGHPRGEVHAVGHVPDGDARGVPAGPQAGPHASRFLAMAARDAVHLLR